MASQHEVSASRAGPLKDIRVIEFAGLGAAPFACQQLSDLGADVVIVDRGGPKYLGNTSLDRGRRSIVLDLKQADDLTIALALVDKAEILVEAFRPGVMERLGIGPDVALARNPALVYGRMTGFGQSGPLAHAPGHDINYVALSGALASIGYSDRKPVPPLNLVGDFAGGLHLVIGLLAALFHARSTGEGQVVDCAMTDSAINLMGLFHSLHASGRWPGGRGRNVLDGGAHYYDTYECADGRYVAVGAIEPQFHSCLCTALGLTEHDHSRRDDRDAWPELKDKIARVFMTRSRDEWCANLEGTDACVSPVLELDEVSMHPHNRARESMTDVFGEHQPAPTPRFSVTPGRIRSGTARADADRQAILRDWGAT